MHDETICRAPLSGCRVVALLLVSCCALTLRAQIVRDSAIIQVQSHIPDSLPGRNIVSRHLNWVQRTFLRPFLGAEKKRYPYKYPPVMAVGRFGVMHYFHRCYVGLNMRYNDITVGQADELQLKINKWNLSLFFGVRI